VLAKKWRGTAKVFNKSCCLFAYSAMLVMLYKSIVHHGLANNKGCNTRPEAWVQVLTLAFEALRRTESMPPMVFRKVS